MAEKIVFTDVTNLHSEYAPKPASHFMPDWLKNMSSYKYNDSTPKDDGPQGTIKKCMPVFDSITAGYIITTPVDIWVTYVPNAPSYYRWITPNQSMPIITFHPQEQIKTHFSKHKYDVPKLVSPWAIETPKGYSCLFIPPLNRENVFTIFPAIVDTDSYLINVELPFLLSDSKFDGLVPAGTPIAQIIPFKRTAWKHRFGGEREIAKHQKIRAALRSNFYHVYKNKFRKEKEYK
jgi:hypothetical protein